MSVESGVGLVGHAGPQTVGDGVIPNRIRILAICLPGAGQLGCALEAVLRPARNVDLWREDVPEPLVARSQLIGRVEEVQPNLLVACLPVVSSAVSHRFFEALSDYRRELSILAILETGPPEDLHRLLNLGAADFCLAPLRLEDLLPRVMRWSLRPSGTHSLLKQLEETLGLQQLVGRSLAFVEALRKIPKLAHCDATVLITGETGTGKEMCARAIHQLGRRSSQPFIPVNCGAIPSELVENELFGHEAGAFTGAGAAARGLLHDAEGGTLFLDEIDSLPLPTQVKFLRFLQEREFRPLGSRTARRADVRVIAASNTDLEGFVRSGRFRPDLFYRLFILPLKLPPLRERREDIPILARHFLAKYAAEFSLPVKDLSRAAVEKLLIYDWPGNVRELENVLERALVLSDQPVIPADDISLHGPSGPAEEASFKLLKARAVAEFEAAYLRRLLAAHDWNISRAAGAAKKNRRAFWQLMRKHRIAPPPGNR